MTEVDVSIPEGSTLSSTVQNSNQANSNTTTSQHNDPNGSNSISSSSKVEGMEIGEADTEEDDSQITSSTEMEEGRVGDGGGTASASVDDNSNNSKLEIRIKSATSLNENSVSQNCENFNTKTVNEACGFSVNSSHTKESDSNTNDTIHEHSKSVQPDTDGEGVSQDSSFRSKGINHLDESSNESKEATPVQDPLAVTQKENGTVKQPDNKQSNDSSIVDLGDDSDVEMSEMPAKKSTNASSKEKVDVGDSDGAVVIGSDSDNDSSAPSKPNTSQQVRISNQMPTDAQVIEDDDDDCVVIEDDTSTTASDITKRKSMAMDDSNSTDDNQPPNKRLRSATANPTQITIKDARTLMPSMPDIPKRNSETGIYPVNITPASPIFPATGPPKLVPVGSPIPPTGLPPLTGLPGMTSNANLLPGLTDDMFVLEAPSFIVPYIYEKPPSGNIKDVMKELETKFLFTKEDLDEVDKTDEFDMMTEQNKEDRDEKSNKKKRSRGDDGDDSWSEESEDEDDDDDDDSESGMRTKVLIKEASNDIAALKGAIKPASAVTQSVGQSPLAVKPGQENYFESPLGKFFMDIGVGLVQEYVQSDLIRLQKRKMRKSLGRNVTDFERAIAALTANLEASKKKNLPFKFNMKRCEFCNFKSESALAMANHYETPHMNGALYKCNFCIFEIRNATEIVYHMEAIHNIKARLIKPLPYHQCPNCGFEDNGKAKLARHQPVCAKKFRPELNLAPPSDWEAPAKIPRIKPRHGLVGTATAYQAMAAQAAAQKAALASIQQQQQTRNMQAAALAAQNAANKMRGRAPQLPQVKSVGPAAAAAAAAAMIRSPNQIRTPAATNVVLPNNYQLGVGGQIVQANAAGKKSLTGQPSISITPLPRQNTAVTPTGGASSPSTSKMPQAGMKPGQTPSGNKTQFVICEICDGYIKDLESLRNHMQWIHKVKIHPKMIYNRPPLNCQKCQFRFFTDQGLERHLLGSHGLVTSSMQEAANKGKDAGRCPVCGRMYQWKLLNHVSRDHHMTLKPAHLSYKCTVCTATFGMYKQFETHVYTAHSTVAKKAMDGKKNSPVPNTPTNSNSGGQRSGLSAANDSLLKPLKINDEITIIPQPSSKPRISNMDTHVID
uniref:MOG interacting and ectopic P-granules protein 1 n=1 Tax=Glossina morsitans morsitans TaxID=37546 RepID=A0A1B0FBZ9_GLOMM